MRQKQTFIMKSYIFKLGIRVFIFAFTLIFYLKDKNIMYLMVTEPRWFGVSPVMILWAIFMVMMLRHIISPKKFTMALLKIKEQEYVEDSYDKLELYEYVHDQNIKAWKVMLV